MLTAPEAGSPDSVRPVEAAPAAAETGLTSVNACRHSDCPQRTVGVAAVI